MGDLGVTAATGAVKAVVEAAKTPAKEAAEQVTKDGAAHLIVAANGMSTGGKLGVTAGTFGLLLTLYNTYKDTIGSQKGITAGSIVNYSSVTLGGGIALLTLGEKTFGENPILRNGGRAVGVGLILGGLVGAVTGALKTNGNPLKREGEPTLMDQVQKPTPFVTSLAPSVNNLISLKVATADVVGEQRMTARVPMYLDTTTTKKLPSGTTFNEAVGQARAAAQVDDLKRSWAVIQTQDGALSIVRMQGDLDQVDGPNYTKDDKYDARFRPSIGRHFESVKAIGGIDGWYDFRETRDPIVPKPYDTEIPWVTPTPTSTPKPTSTATPSAPATAGATPAATASASPTASATASTSSGS
jgi:hypothetical protein